MLAGRCLARLACRELVRFDPASGQFIRILLPIADALPYLAIDPRTRDLCVAYGASPGVNPSRIARIEVR